MKKALLATFLITLMLLPTSIFAYPIPQHVENIFTDWTFTSGGDNGTSGDNYTYDYASYIDFYTLYSSSNVQNGIWIGTSSYNPTVFSWVNTLPDLNVPPDMVTRAKLFIDVEGVDNAGNTISIEGILDWDPLNMDFNDNTAYTLTGIEADEPGFWDDGFLNSSITANELSLKVNRAILMMDYATAVPEPATLLLLGLGLTGLGILRRKK